MTLSKENRETIVNYRLQKAKDTWTEAYGNVKMSFWHTAANRLYYSCYYAVTALLIKNGYTVKTHNGVLTLLGKHFVLKGIVSKEQNDLYVSLIDIRQEGDYDDWMVVTEDMVAPLVEPAQKFIQEMERLINLKLKQY